MTSLPSYLSSYECHKRLRRLDGGNFDVGNKTSRLTTYIPYGGDPVMVRVTWSAADSCFSLSKQFGEFYIAGPMRGYPMFNFPAFLMAARVLATRGIKTCSPAEKDIEAGFDPSRSVESQHFDIGAAFRWDFNAVTRCDGIILLPGWENSTGAKAERLVCHLSHRECYFLDENYILREAPEMDYTLTWGRKPALAAPTQVLPMPEKAPTVECDGDDDEE